MALEVTVLLILTFAGLSGAGPLANSSPLSGRAHRGQLPGVRDPGWCPVRQRWVFQVRRGQRGRRHHLLVERWDQRQRGQPTAAVQLAVSDGLFSVLLGDTTLGGMTQALTAERLQRARPLPAGLVQRDNLAAPSTS